MKKTFLALIFSLFLSITAHAQASAVMRVSVEIVSGVKAEKVSNLYLSNNPLSAHDGEVIISTTPLSDTVIFVQENSLLTNAIGETIEVKTDSLVSKNTTSGKHSISISSTLPKSDQINGQYSGSVVTTIIYL